MAKVKSIDDIKIDDIKIKSIKDVSELNLNQLKDSTTQKKVYDLLLKAPSWWNMMGKKIRDPYAYSNQSKFNRSPIIKIGGEKKVKYNLTFMVNDAKKDIFFYREKDSNLELCKIGRNGGKIHVFDPGELEFIPKGMEYSLLSPATPQIRMYGLVKKINVPSNPINDKVEQLSLYPTVAIH